MPTIRLLVLSVFLKLLPAATAGQDLMVYPLSGRVNTTAQETAPVVTRDGSRLFFTRAGDPEFDRTLIEDSVRLDLVLTEKEYMQYLGSIYSNLSGEKVRDPVSSDFNQDIFAAELSDSGAVTAVAHPGFPLNNALPNSAAALTPFDEELVLVNQFPPDGGLQKGYSVSRRLGDTTWSQPRPLDIDRYRNSGTDATLAMSTDGSVILYSMEGADSRGGADLFVSFKVSETGWSPPLSLGSQINTRYDEVTPFLSDDNGSLFFSSNRTGSSGGKDIYVSFRLDDTWQSWTPARRMKAPINSEADDSQPWFNAHTGILFFSSNRGGSMDIYRSQIAPPNPIVVKVRGQVYNSQTLKPMGARISAAPRRGDSAGGQTATDSPDGAFELSIRKGDEMVLTATRTGYRPAQRTFFFKTSYVYRKVYEVQLFLDPLKAGMTITLSDTLYFKQSTAEILEASWPALDELADFLVENPGMTIRVEGHTDNVGRPEDLKVLSEERAVAVRSYLRARKGVNPDRIACKGFGAERPLTDNSTEELRQRNRRVEIIITGTSSSPSANQEE